MEKHNEFFRTPEQDLLLKWGTRKRMRCVKVQVKSGIGGVDVKIRRTAFRADSEIPQAPRTPPAKPNFTNRAVDSSPEIVKFQKKNIHLMSERSDRIHTRGNISNIKNGCWSTEDMNKVSTDVEIMQEKGCNFAAFEWPKVVITLSVKEKEEDFLAIKGSKLPQRPKKRAKFIQKNLHLVSPGSWLCDLSQERYEVREKKNTKKRPRGLKAMGDMESDSD